MNLRNKLAWYIALNSYVEATVAGVPPLSLIKAKAKQLKSLIAFGGTEQRNIPQPYTQVNYVTNTAQTAVNTGVMIDFAKNYEFEVECRATTGSWYILQSRASSSGNITGISGATSGSTITLVAGNVTACTSAITRTVGHKLYIKATLNAGTATLYVKDETAGTEDTKTGSYETSQPNPTAAMYLFGNAGGQYVGINSDIYMARIKENDTVVMDYVPARQVATAGFYDTVSGTFKTALTPANLSADGEAVPTPDAPMDIVCNNGVLKARHQSGLPLGYTLLDYIESTDTQYINTGYIPTSDIVEYGIEIYGTPDNNSSLFGAQASTGNPKYAGVPFTSSGTTKVYIGGTSSLASVHIPDNQWNKYVLQTTSSTAGKVTLNGVDTVFTYTNGIMKTLEIYLFANNQSDSATQLLSSQVKSFYIKDNGTLVRNFVAAKDSNNIVGMYDLVSGQFFTNAGTGDFVAGNTVSDPVEIYTDGTVETINVHGKNIWNSTIAHAGYSSIGGNIINNTNYCGTLDKYKVTAGETYTISYDNLTGSIGGVLLSKWDSNGDWIARSGVNIDTITKSGSFTVPSGVSKISLSFYSTDGITINNNAWIQLERGSTATDYQPYYNGGTATAEMLLKVGDYQDVQSMLDGVVTRNVGALVLDGTENWSGHSSISGYLTLNMSGTGLYPDAESGYCTHYSWTDSVASKMPNSSFNFKGIASAPMRFVVRDTVNGGGTGSTASNAFKAYLAAQYAAGTPVTVIYPLAQAVTEQVAPQVLNVQTGDNILEITQASLSNLELEAKYKKSA